MVKAGIDLELSTSWWAVSKKAVFRYCCYRYVEHCNCQPFWKLQNCILISGISKWSFCCLFGPETTTCFLNRFSNCMKTLFKLLGSRLTTVPPFGPMAHWTCCWLLCSIAYQQLDVTMNPSKTNGRRCHVRFLLVTIGSWKIISFSQIINSGTSPQVLMTSTLHKRSPFPIACSSQLAVALLLLSQKWRPRWCQVRQETGSYRKVNQNLAPYPDI